MKPVSPIEICLNKMYSRVWVGKHLSDMFTVNDLKKEDAFLLLIFNVG
jgi:hypothetical protein